jgi:hypothetical protein
LAGMSFDGLAGEINFDDLGGNTAKPVLMKLEQGKWVCSE